MCWNGVMFDRPTHESIAQEAGTQIEKTRRRWTEQALKVWALEIPKGELVPARSDLNISIRWSALFGGWSWILFGKVGRLLGGQQTHAARDKDKLDLRVAAFCIGSRADSSIISVTTTITTLPSSTYHSCWLLTFTIYLWIHPLSLFSPLSS